MYRFEKKPLDYASAKEKALKLLEFRAHSKKELYDKLIQKGADNIVASDVISFLTEYNLINDEDYAKRYAHDLVNLKKLGKSRVRTELLKKGISQEIIAQILSELEEIDEDNLYELILKKLKGDFDKKNKDKTMRYFIYKGYSPDRIKDCIEKAELNNDNF